MERNIEEMKTEVLSTCKEDARVVENLLRELRPIIRFLDINRPYGIRGPKKGWKSPFESGYSPIGLIICTNNEEERESYERLFENRFNHHVGGLFNVPLEKSSFYVIEQNLVVMEKDGDLWEWTVEQPVGNGIRRFKGSFFSDRKKIGAIAAVLKYEGFLNVFIKQIKLQIMVAIDNKSGRETNLFKIIKYINENFGEV